MRLTDGSPAHGGNIAVGGKLPKSRRKSKREVVRPKSPPHRRSGNADDENCEDAQPTARDEQTAAGGRKMSQHDERIPNRTNQIVPSLLAHAKPASVPDGGPIAKPADHLTLRAGTSSDIRHGS